MKSSFNITRWWIIIRFVGIIAIAVFWSLPCFAEISPDSYCQLTIKKLRQEIFNLQELIKIEEYGGDEDSKRAEFDQFADALFSSFNTTAKEYVMYMGKNGRAVNAYLKANPDIRQQIAELADQRNALLEEYESLKTAEKSVNNEY